MVAGRSVSRAPSYLIGHIPRPCGSRRPDPSQEGRSKAAATWGGLTLLSCPVPAAPAQRPGQTLPPQPSSCPSALTPRPACRLLPGPPLSKPSSPRSSFLPHEVELPSEELQGGTGGVGVVVTGAGRAGG